MKQFSIWMGGTCMALLIGASVASTSYADDSSVLANAASTLSTLTPNQLSSALSSMGVDQAEVNREVMAKCKALLAPLSLPRASQNTNGLTSEQVKATLDSMGIQLTPEQIRYADEQISECKKIIAESRS